MMDSSGLVNHGVLSGTQITVVSCLFLTTSTLSLLGTSSIIVVTIIKKIVCHKTVLPLFHLCFADFLAGMLLFVGAVYDLVQDHYKWNRACLILTMLTTSLYMTTFLLTVNYAWRVYSQVNRLLLGRSQNSTLVRGQGRRLCISKDTIVVIICWMLPFLVSAIVLFNDTDGNMILNGDLCSSCYPVFVYESSTCQGCHKDASTGNWYTFYKYWFLSFLVFSCIGLVVLYALTYYKYKKVVITTGVIGRRQHEAISQMRRRGAFLTVIFIFSWITTLLLGFISFRSGFKMSYFWYLYAVQAFTSPLQGFLNSIIYGWQRRSFRHLVNANNDNTPLIDPTSEEVEPINIWA